MANTRAQQTTLISTNIPDNSSGLVTPSKVREVDDAQVTAAAFVDDDNAFTGVNTHTAQVRWHKGSNLASGAEITLGNTGNFHHISGNVTINTISTKQHGTRILLYFVSTPLLAHSSALFLPNATNLQVIAGSLYEFISEGGGNWRMLNNDSLNNVVITSIADDQVLQYDLATKSWKNVGFGTALANAIGSSGSPGQIPQTDGAGTLSWTTNGGSMLLQYLRNLTAATVTGVTANTYLTGLLIPANTFTVGNSFDVLVRVLRNTTAGTCTHRIYLNTTNDLAGTPVLVGNAIVTAGFIGLLLSRNLLIRSSTVTAHFPGATNAVIDITQSTSFDLSNIDWTINQYLVVSTQPSAITQTITHYSTVISPH
jgi:hypothetical protein